MDLLSIVLIVLFVAFFGGALLDIGGQIVYALMIIVAIVFLINFLQVII